MKQKPQLNFWQIWNMCFGFIGIQFGFALQNANVSRIFQILGAPIEDIPILWVAAPITGLLIQPIIGYMSDKTWNRFGRRRPYLLIGAVAASLALFVMPNSPELWIAAGMLWIMDASLNISLGPSIALLGDMLPDEQRSTGFSMQSFFIGTSAVIASALPWIFSNWFDIANTAAAGEIPPSVIYSFYVGGTVMLLTIGWASYTTHEYTNNQLQAFSRHKQSLTATFARDSHTYIPFFRNGIILSGIGLLSSAVIAFQHIDYKLYIITAGIALFGVLLLTAAFMSRRNYVENGIFQVTLDLVRMPTTMKRLAVVQFLSWFALFTMWIYGTSAVTSFHYHSTDATSLSYNEGADWVGVLFAAYNGFSALAAIAIPFMVRFSNRKITHIINLCLGAGALISFAIIKNPVWLLASMVAMGFAWASILSMPYAILSSCLPPNKMGVYAGIFNFFIVIPQILASSILAMVVHHFFAGHTIYTMVLAGFFMLLAAGATTFVNDD